MFEITQPLCRSSEVLVYAGGGIIQGGNNESINQGLVFYKVWQDHGQNRRISSIHFYYFKHGEEGMYSCRQRTDHRWHWLHGQITCRTPKAKKWTDVWIIDVAWYHKTQDIRALETRGSWFPGEIRVILGMSSQTLSGVQRKTLLQMIRGHYRLHWLEQYTLAPGSVAQGGWNTVMKIVPNTILLFLTMVKFHFKSLS